MGSNQVSIDNIWEQGEKVVLENKGLVDVVSLGQACQLFWNGHVQKSLDHEASRSNIGNPILADASENRRHMNAMFATLELIL